MAKPKRTPESSLHLVVNGHRLDGIKRRGVWVYACPSWPELEQQFAGRTAVAPAVAAFLERALGGAVRVAGREETPGA